MKHIIYFIFFCSCFACKNNKKQPVQNQQQVTHVKQYRFPNNKKYLKEVQHILQQEVKDSLTLQAWQIAIEKQQYTPIFNSAKKIQQVKTILQQANDNGLGVLVKSELENINEIQNKIAQNNFSHKELYQAEIRYRKALNRYSNALQFGVLNPKKVFPKEYYINNKTADSLWFANDFQQKDYLTYLQQLKVNNPLYELLVDKYKKLTIEPKWEQVKAPKKLVKIGNKYSEIPKLRKRFQLPEVADTASNYLVYEQELANKIKDFQAEHALSNDGIIGATTVDMLNQTPEELKLKVEAVLERLRWNNGHTYKNAYVANIPEFKLYVMENGKLAKTFDIGVGLANRHHTPEFIDTMEYVVVNPTWTVPYSIASKEMLPKIKRNSSYLTRNNYRLLRGSHEINPSTVNWNQYTRRNFPFTIVQKPGNSNALGRIKFLFPNKYAIYFHDTPSKYIFENTSRAVSHGCVRVKNPFDLGDFVMNNDPKYLKAKQTDVLTNFKAKKGYPVLITYVTTVVTPEGKLRNVGDVYGKDAILQKAWKAFKTNYQ